VIEPRKEVLTFEKILGLKEPEISKPEKSLPQYLKKGIELSKQKKG
jgi:hypothetical protein